MPKRSPFGAVNIAYVEDADDDGHVLSGAEPKYARSTAPGSPRKQQPNTSKARRDPRSAADVCSSTDSSGSTAHPITGKGKPKARPKDDRRSSAIVTTKQRPPMRSTKTAPALPSRTVDDQSAYYPPLHPASLARPRAHTRPESYYGQSASRQPPPPRPPISGAPFYPHPPPPLSMIAPPPVFPPNAWPAPYPGGHMQPPPPPQQAEPPFPPNRDLSMRFRRPSSSMGFRQPPSPYEYEPAPERTLARRPSVSRKISKDIKEHDDRKRMPPPPRPKSTRPERVERMERPERHERIILKPQPMVNSARKSVVFDDDDLEDDESAYHSDDNSLRRGSGGVEYASRRGSGVEYGSRPFKNRRQSFDASESVFNYDDDDDSDEDDEDDDDYDEYYSDDEPAPRSRSRRRSSHAEIVEKMRDASRYQDTLGGGPSSALTADALRRVKTRASSRSTRSSASRDDSDYKQHSASTHTTRSSSGEDDITIKVSAGCVVEVGNVKIRSGDGGEISVGRNAASRMGSDRASTYGDERHMRSDRSSRTRASSRAAYARGLPAPASYSHGPSPLYSQQRYSDDDSDCS